MPNVLIRDVPTDDLERIRSAAAVLGVSLQSRLRDIVHAQASCLHRQEELDRASARLRSNSEAPDAERQAVLDAIESAHASRADDLRGRATR